jgi:hypothetical protein
MSLASTLRTVSFRLRPALLVGVAAIASALQASAQCTPTCPGDCNCDGIPDTSFLMAPRPDGFVMQLTTTQGSGQFGVTLNDGFGNGGETAWIGMPGRIDTVDVVTGPQHGFSAPSAPTQQLPFSTVTLGTFYSHTTDFGGIIDYVGYQLADQCCNTSPTAIAVYSVRSPVGNRVLGLNGTNWVRVADAAALDFTNALSVDCWFKADVLADMSLVDKWGDNGLDDRSFSVGLRATGQIQFGLSRSDTQLDNAYHTFLAGSVQPQVWHHVACTFDGARRRIYLDGILVGDRASAGPMHVGITDLSIGAHLENNAGAVSGQFQGRIERVRIWRSSLTQRRIREICALKEFTDYSAPRYSSLEACFEFENSFENTDTTQPLTESAVGALAFPVDDTPPVLLFDCDGNGLPEGFESPSFVDANANGVLDACENYETFCFGDGYGAPCPCGNKGAPGRGCANSANVEGAQLKGSGVADVSSDTFVLTASGMPATSTALFVQFESVLDGGLGAPLGDGLLCLSGTLIRLGTRAATAGVATYPSLGSPTVSVRGMVPPGSVRYYQAHYRNAAAFCTASTFNLTNAMRVNWIP